jgi:quercetin dioxygenase-like cupin family protein/DNA-binding XRE family transcriptional regulator
MQQAYAEIARRVKALREMAGLSRESFARELKIDPERYRSYEEGEEDIPVGVLIAAASRLGVDVTALITGEEPRLKVYSLVRKGRGLDVERRKEYRYRDLAYNFQDRRAEVFLVTVDPGRPSEGHGYSHEGQEFNYLLSGRMKVMIDGHELVLEEGDSLYFDSGKEHSMAALGDASATFLAVTVASGRREEP